MPTRGKSKIILLLLAYYHSSKKIFCITFFDIHTRLILLNVMLFFITELPPDLIYCCERYKELIYALINHPAAQKPKSEGKISIAPHPPYGSKQARKVAKERAAQR